MYRFWTSIIEPICCAADVRSVVEIGIGEGHMTRLLLAHIKKCGGSVHAIDPAPASDMITLCAEGGQSLIYHAKKSIDVLPTLSADLVTIDGDHNWYTVLHELRILSQWVSAGTCEPIVLLHDTEWPYGRRDMYYDKESIPAAYCKPSALRGMLPSKAGLEHNGGLNADLENALEEGGPRNGVRTAVEDFLKEEPDRWHWQNLQGMHGLGILVPRSHLMRQPALSALLNNIHPNRYLQAHMDMLENDRLRELASNATTIWRMRHQSEQMRKLQERYRTAESEIENLQSQILQTQSTIDTLQSAQSILQTENERLNTIIDTLEKRHTHLLLALADAHVVSKRIQETLDHIHTTRTFRWTAWIRKYAGILQRKHH